MNETKCFVYVPFHPELGYRWKWMTIDYSQTINFGEWKWYQIVVDGDKKEEIK